MSLQPIDGYLQDLAAIRRRFEEDFGMRLYDLGATAEVVVESVLQDLLENRGYRWLEETYVLALHDKTNLFWALPPPLTPPSGGS